MSDISKIDKNFVVQTEIQKDDIKFYSVEEAPFKVFGVYKQDGMYRRLPESVSQATSEGVLALHADTAGGRVRFITDSKYVAVSAELGTVRKMAHFPLTGTAGFDMYDGDNYVKTFVPPYFVEDKYEGLFEFPEKEVREITINFPLYSQVKNLYIGLEEKAIVKEPKPYVNEKPVVYYGSSITQGGCASRPGMSYQSIVSRKLNCDYINLGFSGSAKGEDAMIDYIKNLDMKVFVYDYDHNAPSEEHLEATHEKMYKAVRQANPDLPIIIMSRPKIYLLEHEEKRLHIIEKTYQNAVNSGDKNVYFIKGADLFRFCGNEGTVDGCHPTDFGFNSMAQVLAEVMMETGIF